MSNWTLKGVKKTVPNVQCPPWRVCVCLLGWGGGGGVWTTDTYTLGLDCKTVGQNQFCKARSKA